VFHSSGPSHGKSIVIQKPPMHGQSFVAAQSPPSQTQREPHAEPCQTIRGRAAEYSGDGYLEIWHVGTHHTFFVVDQKPTDLILATMYHKVDGPLQALFADFTICPTAPFRQGHAQAAVVKRIENSQIATLKKRCIAGGSPPILRLPILVKKRVGEVWSTNRQQSGIHWVESVSNAKLSG